MKKYFLTFNLVFFMTILCMSQNIIPPSPVASTFTIYGDYPVSNSTGVPDIQIPLYTFKCGDIEVPIVLKYHIGSAKPNPYNVEMSNVGYGWVIDVGGIVSRTVMGKQDEYGKQEEYGKIASTIKSTDLNQSNETDYWTLHQISTNSIDSEYDIFNYNFFNENGNFVIEQKASGNYDAIIFPFKPLKINIKTDKTNDGYNNTYISAVDITNDKGYNFVFDAIESNSQLYSGWFLSGITSPGNRSVGFTYMDRSIHVNATGERFNSLYIDDNFQGYNVMNAQMPNLPSIMAGSDPVSLSCETKTIKEINSTSSGKVVFNLNANNSKILDFTVFDASGKQITKVAFTQSKFPNQNVYDCLESVSFLGQNNDTIQKYIFQYNPQSVLNSKNVDYWGWYNGNANSSYFPLTTCPYVYSNNYWIPINNSTYSFGGNDRCCDAQNILAQTLNKIIYPTGGSTEFVFEPNEYSGALTCSNTSIGAGLRIKSIINRDAQNVLTTKSYEYSVTSMILNRFDYHNYYHYSYDISVTNNPDGIGHYLAPGYFFKRSRSFSENINGYILDSHINYPSVTEYIGTSTLNSGKNIYTYNFNNNHEYRMLGGFLDDFYIVLDKYKNWGNGELSRVETFKRETDQTYTKVKEVFNEYGLYNDTLLHSLGAFRISNYPTVFMDGLSNISGMECTIRDYIIANSSGFPTPPIFGTYDYYIQTGVFLPTKVTETNFFPSPVTRIIENKYDNGNKKYVTSTILKDNTTTLNTKRFKYPYDYPSTTITNTCEIDRQNCLAAAVTKRDKMLSLCYQITDPSAQATCTSAYTSIYNNDVALCKSNFASCNSIAPTDQQVITEMQNKNMINPVIEAQTSQFKNNITAFTGGTINKFKKENGLIVPGEKYELEINNPLTNLTPSSIDPSGALIFHSDYHKKLTYDKYDEKGNILQYHQSDNINTSFLWSYNGSMPIVKGDNVTYDILNTAVIAAGATNLETFWSGFNNIATDAAQQTTWKNFNTALRSTTSLANARITTYTYTPLIGMTSQTDPNGITTYYEYDSFGRLKLVKDNDTKILKTYDYHYKE